MPPNHIPLSVAQRAPAPPPPPSAPASPSREHARRRRRTGLPYLLVALLVGILAASALVWRTSTSAFAGSTDNPGNSWSLGAVSLTDDDAGTSMFNASGLVPGLSGSRCITVTYGGSVAANVRLFLPTTTGPTVQPYLAMVVEEGSGGGFASCAGFTAGATLYAGTLDGLAGGHGSYADGLGTWAPTGAGQSRTFRITYTLDPSTPDALQGASATATFQWEARSA